MITEFMSHLEDLSAEQRQEKFLPCEPIVRGRALILQTNLTMLS